MYVIVCKLGNEKFYVPEVFEDGMYSQDSAKAKRFPNSIIAQNFMIENDYAQNDWYRWEIEQI